MLYKSVTLSNYLLSGYMLYILPSITFPSYPNITLLLLNLFIHKVLPNLLLIKLLVLPNYE